MRNTVSLPKRVSGRNALALGLAAMTLGAGLSLTATGTSVAAPPPAPPAPSAPAGTSGSSAHPQQPPSYMDQGIELWEHMGWPNWRAIANRNWITAGSFVNPSTHQRVNEIIFSGGRYEDRDGRLRAFLNSGSAGSASMGYTGTFQEYNTTVYHQQLNSAVPRRDANRIVRAVNTGDLFWTNDHYSTFHYMGRH
ncbi:hypothetical protein [Streptomyces mirabilis]|uniref:hypothetical protein n=1 Tax=Streptomyces mirabilis TaxID=68239 RepID=UPI00364CBDDB